MQDENGNELEGIVQHLICSNCEADVEYKVVTGNKEN